MSFLNQFKTPFKKNKTKNGTFSTSVWWFSSSFLAALDRELKFGLWTKQANKLGGSVLSFPNKVHYANQCNIIFKFIIDPALGFCKSMDFIRKLDLFFLGCVKY